ncbi:MAG TPA: AtpZ/AtpI family protein [Chitinophagaceae bacterium]|nr:AtpZ/AtpI family protein [Chitinophagaceae bacterium]
MSQQSNNNKKDLMRYAGLATQMLVGLGIAVFIGLKADKWLKLSFPILSWLLPLLVLAAIIYQIIKETGPKNNEH